MERTKAEWEKFADFWENDTAWSDKRSEVRGAQVIWLDPNKTWYLAGPMSYVPQFNFPLFDSVAAALRLEGFTIVSPAELDSAEVRESALASATGEPSSEREQMLGQTWGDFLARDVKIIADMVDGIILLPRWYTSRGACLEAYVGLLTGTAFATYGYGKPVPRSPEYVRTQLMTNGAA